MVTKTFAELYNLSLSGIVEKKGGLDYISWSNAWKLAMENDPEASFEIIDSELGIPLFTDRGNVNLVKTKVTFNGKTKSMTLPIMDNRNKAKPYSAIDSRDVSDSIMRCLTKNIALFGIGLKLYVGEDLVDRDPASAPKNTLTAGRTIKIGGVR